MADAIRRREFDHQDVAAAVQQGRLRVKSPVADDDLVATLVAELAALRADGNRSVGVFAHSNQGVASLAAVDEPRRHRRAGLIQGGPVLASRQGSRYARPRLAGLRP